MKKMKKIAAAALAAVMVLSMTACGEKKEETKAAETEAATEAAAEKEVLRVGLSADYPPFEFYTADDPENPVGIDVEVAKYIADKLGMELQITDMSFDGLLASLNEDKFDLVISAMTIKADRACLFSDPYYSATQAVVVKKGNEEMFASVDDLMGKKIGGQMGAIQEELATQYAGETAQIVGNVQDMIMMVAEGKIDGLICESGVAQSAVAKNDALAIATVEIPYEENNLGICAKEGNTELMDKVNPIVAEIVEKNLTGEWQLEFIDMQAAE